MAHGPGGTPGGLVTSSLQAGPDAMLRPGRMPCCGRPACGRTGWAEARAGPYRPTYVREREREKEKDRTTCETGGQAAAPDRGWCRGCSGAGGAGLKVEVTSDGLQESSMAQLRRAKQTKNIR